MRTITLSALAVAALLPCAALAQDPPAQAPLLPANPSDQQCESFVNMLFSTHALTAMITATITPGGPCAAAFVREMQRQHDLEEHQRQEKEQQGPRHRRAP